MRHVWVNGQLLAADEPHLSLADRGFQLGDGIFETMRARRGIVIECDDHLSRLAASANLLAIRVPPSSRIAEAIDELLNADGLASDGADGSESGDAAIRVTVSRGPIETRGLLPAGFDTTEPTVVVQAWPYAPPPLAYLERGLAATISAIRRDPRSPLSGCKSISRAEHVYAKLEAQRAGADDALFLTTDGDVSEATSSNVFVIRSGRLRTPSLGAAILAGTTRTWALTHAADVGLVPEEGRISPDDMIGTDEAFLSSSVAGILPLVALDGRPIGSGRPGTLTMRLRESRERWIDEQSRVPHR